MIPLAHSARKEKPAQSYRDHIAGVVSNVRKTVESILPFAEDKNSKGYFSIVATAALYHDLGKLSPENQAILRGEKESSALALEHRDAGVKHLLGNDFENPSATLIYAHHYPGLPDLSKEINHSNPFRFAQAMADSDDRLSTYLEIHQQAIGDLDEVIGINSCKKLSAMEYRILLSCLVDADYSDTAGKELSAAETRWSERLEKLDHFVNTLHEQAKDPHSERNQLRNELYTWCRNALLNGSIEYCDAPVGTGKTTAIMARTLRVAQKKGLRHIIVVIPYTNIISQTVEVLREALVLEGENSLEIVAEHHHQADFESTELRHLATTWTAPIIVTTAVQFFETLASNMPSKLRKLHQLPGSAVIIDESHAALPIELMLPAWKWIMELIRNWGCYFCLSSGTSFKFWENSIFAKFTGGVKVNQIVTDSLSQKLEIFEANRIHINAWEQDVPHFQNIVELRSCIEEFHGSRVIVLNTVRAAAYLAKTLRDSNHDVLHLSTAISPQDKDKIILEVKRRLHPDSNYKKDWTLVATSCVECGMNFSFRHGFCELRSLQSYLQLGGRVNRNWEYGDSSLICFTIMDNNFRDHSSFGISKNVFRKLIRSNELESMTITMAVTKSFNMECKQMGDLSDSICKSDTRRDFSDVAKSFRVISEDTVTVVVDPEIISRLRSGESVSPRELQRGSVNVHKSILRELGIAEMELPFLEANQYDGFLGYMKGILEK